MNKDSTLHPIPPASATAIFVGGNQANEAARIRFLNYLVREACFDAYPRRAEFIAAFSAGGGEDSRRIEAHFVASACIFSSPDIADAMYWAEDKDARWQASDSDEIR